MQRKGLIKTAREQWVAVIEATTFKDCDLYRLNFIALRTSQRTGDVLARKELGSITSYKIDARGRAASPH